MKVITLDRRIRINCWNVGIQNVCVRGWSAAFGRHKKGQYGNKGKDEVQEYRMR